MFGNNTMVDVSDKCDLTTDIVPVSNHRSSSCCSLTVLLPFGFCPSVFCPAEILYCLKFRGLADPKAKTCRELVRAASAYHRLPENLRPNRAEKKVRDTAGLRDAFSGRCVVSRCRIG